MSYKKILILIEHLKQDHVALKAALDIANLYNSSVTALHLTSHNADVSKKTVQEYGHDFSRKELDYHIEINNSKLLLLITLIVL